MTAPRSFANAVGFDDAPFERGHRGDVDVVGAVFGGERLHGIVRGRVRRDGADSARVLAALVNGSKYREHVQLIFLQGVALAGFNVVDVAALHAATGKPVLVVARKEPDREAVRRALLEHVPGGAQKWPLVERLGPMEPCAGVWVQRVGLAPAAAEAAVRFHARFGRLPEPLRVAHLVATGLHFGESRGRV
ncbi:MAG: DUF99 family protein [Rhodothermales bacterium]|nr:DUF99 family protein [Rhodothermales bacterium]